MQQRREVGFIYRRGGHNLATFAFHAAWLLSPSVRLPVCLWQVPLPARLYKFLNRDRIMRSCCGPLHKLGLSPFAD
jgi:hypothetical protein